MTAVAIKERPIVMHAFSVKAILEDRKTQTRRIIKPQPIACGPEVALGVVPCPYGKSGDRLWVREMFSYLESFLFFDPAVPDPVPSYWYWADGQPEWGDWTRPKPSIHMPREASRLTLEVTNTRVERIQDISHMDALAEGVAYDVSKPDGSPLPRFKKLWDETNGKGAWDRNDWVWVVEFEKV